MGILKIKKQNEDVNKFQPKKKKRKFNFKNNNNNSKKKMKSKKIVKKNILKSLSRNAN